MAPRIDLMNNLMGGTEAMRHAGETYLPREIAESERNYKIRLERAVLLNYFERTVESLVGKPFSKPVQLADDMPQELKDLSENIDRLGNHINVFARHVFRDGLVKGLTHILVEFPDTSEQPSITLADERIKASKPYFVHIPPENILAAYAELVDGVETLTHVRISEVEVKRDGFDEIIIQRVRVLEPGTWTLWRKMAKNRWEIEKSGTTSLPVIPLVTFYADREDFMVARPPLTDLAHINIAHWQSSSDQRNILTVARFPILCGSGLQEEESQVKMGPRQLLTTVSADGKFYYLEHSGKAIEGGRQDLEDLKSEMAMLGIELLTKSGNMTATAKAIDSSENISMLQAYSMLFGDTLEGAYLLAAQWMGLAQGGSVTINQDFGLKLNQDADLQVLQAARTAREISHEQYIIELIRRGVLDDDFDVEDDALLLESENQKAITDAAFQQKLATDGIIPPGGGGGTPLRLAGGNKPSFTQQ